MKKFVILVVVSALVLVIGAASAFASDASVGGFICDRAEVCVAKCHGFVRNCTENISGECNYQKYSEEDGWECKNQQCEKDTTCNGECRDHGHRHHRGQCE